MKGYISDYLLWDVEDVYQIPNGKQSTLPHNKHLDGPNSPLVLTNLKPKQYIDCYINIKLVCPICLYILLCLHGTFTYSAKTEEFEAYDHLNLSSDTNIIKKVFKYAMFVSVPTLEVFTWHLNWLLDKTLSSRCFLF